MFIMEERVEVSMKEDKLEKIDRKLDLIFEEIVLLQRRLDDKRMDEREEKLKREEEDFFRKREDIMIERTMTRNHYEEKYNNFKKGYYW